LLHHGIHAQEFEAIAERLKEVLVNYLSLTFADGVYHAFPYGLVGDDGLHGLRCWSHDGSELAASLA
jgi:hypothetical protein